MKIYLATWLFDETIGRSLTKKRGNRRLISYYFLKEQGINSEQFRKYCQSGRLKINKRNKDV